MDDMEFGISEPEIFSLRGLMPIASYFSQEGAVGVRIC